MAMNKNSGNLSPILSIELNSCLFNSFSIKQMTAEIAYCKWETTDRYALKSFNC